MRGRVILLSFYLLGLAACEKDFDERYQENLEQLNQEAKEIEARVEQQLAEGREADKVIQPEEEAENSVEPGREAAD